MRAIAITLLVLAVGCGGEKSANTDSSGTSAASTARTTTLAPTTTVAPTTTINPLFAMRADYLVMETEWNTASEVVYNAHVGSEGSFTGVLWEDQPTWCAEQVVVDEKLAADITAYLWPSDLQAMADEVSLALTVRAGVFHECSQLPGSFIGQSPIFDRQDAAYEALLLARIKLRTALGLPGE